MFSGGITGFCLMLDTLNIVRDRLKESMDLDSFMWQLLCGALLAEKSIHALFFQHGDTGIYPHRSTVK